MPSSIPDLWDTCYDGVQRDLKSPEAFRAEFCQRCMNAGCRLSRGAGTSWVKRIMTQEDRLLDNPVFAEPGTHREIAGMRFQDMLQEALSIEISSRKGDWSVPTQDEIGLEAARLAGLVPAAAPQGFEPPEPDHVDPPDKLVDEVQVTGLDGKVRRVPAPAGGPAPEPAPPERPLKGSWKVVGDSGTVYLVRYFEDGDWDCECEGFKFSKDGTCKHIESVSRRLNRAPKLERPSRPPPPEVRDVREPLPPGNRAPTFTPKKGLNTGSPEGGVLLGGASPPQEPHDPWAPPKAVNERVIPVGGKVRFKKK